MARLRLGPIQAIVFAASLTLPSTAQNPPPPSQLQLAPSPLQSPGSAASGSQPSPQAFTLQTTTRMVNLEIVVEDSKRQHIDGLKASDFQIFEQTPAHGKEKREQKIVEFREVHVANLAPPPVATHDAPGVYSNAVTVSRDPVPPTVLLVDGLNTPLKYQPQVHVQMLKMLRQLPPNVPVAVFLLGDRLAMLQSFTTDPKLLQAALNKVTTPASVGVADIQTQDNPDAPSNSASGFGSLNDSTYASAVAALQSFDQAVYSAQMDERVLRTSNALASIGHNLAGYPGRKNLLWLSTAFPLTVDPYGDVATQRNFSVQLQRVNAALSDAKITVYPVNVAGVTTLSFYEAGSRPPDTSPNGVSGAIQRQDLLESNQQDTMEVLANGTGGKICTGDNDLGDCVRKAVEDSSDFYEIAYYPDSPYWDGEFREISVKTETRGAHLSYRQGYFANPEGTLDPKLQQAELQADCNDYLNATEIPFTARNLPGDSPDQLKFSLLVDASPLTFALTPDGGHRLNLNVAVCTYNEKQWPLNLMNYPVNFKLSPQQYQTVMSTGKLTDTIRVPGPKPAAVRLLVKDVASGKLGSILIKTDGPVAETMGAAR